MMKCKICIPIKDAAQILFGRRRFFPLRKVKDLGFFPVFRLLERKNFVLTESLLEYCAQRRKLLSEHELALLGLTRQEVPLVNGKAFSGTALAIVQKRLNYIEEINPPATLKMLSSMLSLSRNRVSIIVKKNPSLNSVNGQYETKKFLRFVLDKSEVKSEN